MPNAARVRLRTACIATCGSSAHAWTTRSPSLRVGLEVVAREVGERDEAVGQPVGEAEPVAPRRPSAGRPTNSDRPNPNVIVRPGRRQVLRPRRCRPGGASYGPARRPERPGGQPGAEPRGDRRPRAGAASTSSSRDVVVRSNAAVYIRSCAGVTMPAWCAPVNGYVPAAVPPTAGSAADDAPRARRSRRTIAERRAAPTTASPTGRRAQEGSRRESVLRSVDPAPVIVAVSVDSGSLRASTAAASAWTSAWLSSS